MGVLNDKMCKTKESNKKLSYNCFILFNNKTIKQSNNQTNNQ